jgi:phospholipase/lecithinase/hemolysin
VEVLAQRQGLVSDTNKNYSYYGHYSSELVDQIKTNSFNAPDASTALVVVWVNNADFVQCMTDIFPTLDLARWSNTNAQSLANHFQVVTNLYAKGVRTLILPNAVDITKIPEYNQIADGAQKAFIRQRIAEFNTGLMGMASNLMSSLPGLTIYVPDVFSLFDDVILHAADYGLTNALYAGQSIDVIGDDTLGDKSLNGPGANYIFWDYQAPTAKLHAVIADYVQQLLSPPYLSGITAGAETNSLSLANVPIGRNGLVEVTTNFVNWTPAQNFTSSNATQTVAVPAAGPQQFYRLRFPLNWTWP